MNYKGASLYDEDDFFKQYIGKRLSGKAVNDLIEKPIIDELLGNVQDQHILDLGCGDGRYGRYLLEKGAKYYVGIDGSTKMLKLAEQHLFPTHSKLIHQKIEHIQLGKDEFDIVLSRLVLHYIEHLKPIFDQVAQCLRKNGIFVFSIEHPTITSCFDAYHAGEKRQNWIVDHYFSSGERIHHWLGKEVVKYHKTIEEYWLLAKHARFQVTEIRESTPRADHFQDAAHYERRKRIPLFLMFQLTKV